MYLEVLSISYILATYILYLTSSKKGIIAGETIIATFLIYLIIMGIAIFIVNRRDERILEKIRRSLVY